MFAPSKRHGVIRVVKSRGRDMLDVAADLVGPRGRVRFPAILAPYGLVAMRAVVAVLLFVTAAHAALWGVLREKQQAPDFRGILPSVSYAPFEGTGHPDVDNIANAEKIRADLKKLSHPDASDPPVLVDRRRRTGAADRRGVRPQGHGRRLDRQERRPQRARNRSPRSTSPSATAMSSASSSATKRSTAASRRSKT